MKSTSVSCVHCGLPVPEGLIDPEQDEQFCCGGCSAAWKLIHANDLDAFYRMVDSDQAQQSLQKRAPTQPALDTFDDPGFLEKFTRCINESERTVTLALSGIHCAACVWLIEKLPTIVPGVLAARVNWSRGTVTIEWVPDQVPLSTIAQTLHRLGYTPHPVRTDQTTLRRQKENRRQLAQIGIAAGAAGNNMLIAIALYYGMFTQMAAGMETMFRVASCLIGLVSYLGPGRLFLHGAWNAIKTRTPHMDLPVAVGLTAAAVAGLVNTVRGEGEIYFDSLSVLIFLLLVGRWIQFRQQNRAADAIDLLYRLTPQRARKIVNQEVIEIGVDDLQVGDLIEVRPGDLIPADGKIVQGDSQIDQSILTGESQAIQKSEGDDVWAGTQNLNAVLHVKVLATGLQTRISQIVELVEQATLNKPQVVQWANRIGGYFVVVVLLLALVTLGLWLFIDSSRAIDRAIAVLIVACPCALALATPLAISVALGRLAKRRVLVKSGDVLQSLNRPGMIWLDKTGTLTEGRLQVVQWWGDRSILPAMGAIESQFNHPVARSLVEFSEKESIKGQEGDAQGQEGAFSPRPSKQERGIVGFDSPVTQSQQLAGGVSAIVDGKRFLIGNRHLMEMNGVTRLAEWNDRELDALANGQSPCWIAVDEEVVALAALGDAIREDAEKLIDELKQMGWTIGILSGDHPEMVQRVAVRLKIDRVHAGVTPEQKLAIVQRSLDDFETTVMVGDGVNDSGALAAATVGIAVHNGAEASLAAAPVYLGEPGLMPIREMIRASQSTARTIRINFAASIAYNLLGVGLAMVGWLNPLVAAILMPVSSLTVITLSLNAARARETR